jgi:hypothetical protein
MPTVQIREAIRENVRIVFGLTSNTGDGKTRSAIEVAYGLCGGDTKKMGFLDTENRRGSLYADCLVSNAWKPTRDRFLIADLAPPFSPERYRGAIDDFEHAGVDVLVIDSVSHEWEGTGGCDEIAHAGNPRTPRWNLAKEEHKKFMNKLLQCDMHIIVCVRAREKTKMQTGSDGKLQFVPIGLQPITEKSFMFELTASLMLFEQGRVRKHLKMPEELKDIVGHERPYLTSEDGYRLRQWLQGAHQVDQAVEKFRNRLLANTDGGVKHINECWGKTPAEVRAKLGDVFLATLVKAAEGYEKLRETQKKPGDRDEEFEAGRNTERVTRDAAGATDSEEDEQISQLAAQARANAAEVAAKDAAAKTSETSAQASGEPAKTSVPAAATASEKSSAAEKIQTQAKPVEKRAPPDNVKPAQKELAPPVTGVLDSDPVF